MIILGLFENA